MTFQKLRVVLPTQILFLSLLSPVVGFAKNSDKEYKIKNTFHSDFRKTPKVIFDFQSSLSFAPQGKGKELVESYLKQSQSFFEIDRKDLKLDVVKKSITGSHYEYSQYYKGYPVLNGAITVSVDKSETSLQKVFNNTYPTSQEVSGLIQRHISQSRAYDLVWNDLEVRGKIIEKPSTKKVFLATREGLRLVYQVWLAVESPFGYWEYLVDVTTGEILAKSDRRITRRKVQFFNLNTSGAILDREKMFKKFFARSKKANSFTDSRKQGTGLVFDPDPRTTLGTDQISDDSSASEFETAYFSRPLLGLSFDGQKYHLKGPWVQIADFESPEVAPSTSETGEWSAKRGNNAFNDVMTYYHIDKNQRYMQSLGFTGSKGIQEVSIEIDSNGLNGSDNSHYIPSSNRIAFGHGCVDDNEDADVILHEYGHAINYSINRNWNGGDTGAMGEGFGDYWAGSYSISIRGGMDYKKEDVFQWDGGSCWPGRKMNRMSAMYDHGKTYRAHESIGGGIQSDELWSTPLFQALLTLLEMGEPRENVDRIILEAQFGLGSGLKMRDMADAIIQTARQMHPNGPYAQVFTEKFLHHKIIELPAANIGLSGINIKDSGNDGGVDPGEEVTMSVNLTNKGNHAAVNIKGVLSSLSDGAEVISGQSTYGDLTAGQAGGAQTVYRWKTNGDLQCGEEAKFALSLSYEGGASSSQKIPLSFILGKAQIAKASQASSLEIPDNQPDGLESKLMVNSAGRVSDIKVSLNIEHSYIGDLNIELIAPSGKKVILHKRSGGSQNNIEGTYPLSLSPAEDLKKLTGENVSGEWTLKVGDNAPRDTGRLLSWGLEIVTGYVCQ